MSRRRSLERGHGARNALIMALVLVVAFATIVYVAGRPNGDNSVTLVAGDGRQVLTKSRARNHQLALLRWSTDYFDPNSNAQFFCENGDDTDASPLKVMAWRCHFQAVSYTHLTLPTNREV